jgi:hypothetical protein
MRLLHCATPMIALAVASDGQAGCAVERESSGAGHAGENGRPDEGTSPRVHGAASSQSGRRYYGGVVLQLRQ